MRDGIVVAAPCKINTHLRVMDRRTDGFHDIESVFQALSFGDELRFVSLKERFVCDVRMDGPVPPERNIVYKAVSAFRLATGFDGGVRIDIEKRIPFGAGLGGGSSDAAAALVALNRMSGSTLSPEGLERLAAELGSDVPFFQSGGTALVTGRGERVRPIDANLSYAVVLVHPGFSSDTAAAYRLLDEARANGSIGSYAGISIERVSAAVRSDPSQWPFFNDFLPALRRTAPAYDTLLEDLRASGALFSALSGSGSACFGIYSNLSQAYEAEKSLVGRWPTVRTAVPLARSGNPVLE
jgi:4-diphosphocytidyl-2-C-methyl-D-erythritol kinase